MVSGRLNIYEALLHFYYDAGVDYLLLEQPNNPLSNPMPSPLKPELALWEAVKAPYFIEPAELLKAQAFEQRSAIAQKATPYKKNIGGHKDSMAALQTTEHHEPAKASIASHTHSPSRTHNAPFGSPGPITPHSQAASPLGNNLASEKKSFSPPMQKKSALKPSSDERLADALAPIRKGANAATRNNFTIPSANDVLKAREIALQAKTLEELKEAMQSFEGCALKYTAKNTCFADGTAGSPLMIIGEAPGGEEDRHGLPFVGPAGQLLNKMLQAIGLTRENVYITNTIPWRPPGNRTPTALEMEICRPFLERHIELAQPKMLLALGAVAAKNLLGDSKASILRIRGVWQKYYPSAPLLEHPAALLENKNEKSTPCPASTPAKQAEKGTSSRPAIAEAFIPFMPSLHPAYLLRSPAQKKLAWEDLLAVKKHLQEIALQQTPPKQGGAAFLTDKHQQD